MTQWLKQATATTIKVGPFVDDADGKTAETALTIAQADIRLSKNGGNIAQTNNIAGATHDELGYYDVPLNTIDTDTLGSLKVLISVAGALPVWAECMVLPANAWDSLFGADKLQVHVDEISAGIITAAAIATDAIDADALAADAIAEINATVDTALADYDAPTKAELDAAIATLNDISVADILAATIEGGETLQETLVYLLALTGKTAGGGTTSVTFYGVDGVTPRLSYTVDAYGNRSVATRNAA